MSDYEPLRVLVIGPTGSGKSSTANTILMAAEGQDKMIFTIREGTGSITRFNEEHTRTVLGREITIVDTPGADNTLDTPRRILEEIRAAIERSSDDFDAILYVVDIFKDHLLLDDLTLKVFKMAEKALGREFWSHVVLVFTYKESFYRLQEEQRGSQYEVFPFKEYIARDKLSNNTHAIGPHVEVVKDAAAIIENDPEMEENKRSEMVEQVIIAIEKVKAKNEQGFNKTMLTNNPEYPMQICPPWVVKVVKEAVTFCMQNILYFIIAFLVVIIAILVFFMLRQSRINL